MNLGHHLDRKRARAVVGSGAAIAALLTAGVVVASALAGKPAKHSPTTTTGTTVTLPTSGKVAVCHRTGSAKHPSHTINVNVHAWKAHERHGDVLGACVTTTTATTTTTSPSTSTATTAAAPSAPGRSGDAHGNSANAPGHNKH